MRDFGLRCRSQHPSRRPEYERPKLAALRMLGRMTTAGVLRRVAWNFVLIADQEKDQNQGQQLAPVDLPEPRI